MIESNSNIAIIIVFFNPTNQMIEKASQLHKSFSVYVADNSERSLSNNPDFIYLPLFQNKGIAEAQNHALRRALMDNMEYVIFLDQDSCITNDDIIKLTDIFCEIEKRDPSIAALGPILINDGNNTPYKTAISLTNEKRIKVNTLISSGTITKIKFITEVGLMDESLFIDYVDFDWCWRVNKAGYSLYMTREVELRHQVGQFSFHVAGLAFIKSSHKRYYYRFRNLFILSRRNYVPFRWKVKTLIHSIIELVLVVVHPAYNGERKIILKNIGSGIKDGLIRK